MFFALLTFHEFVIPSYPPIFDFVRQINSVPVRPHITSLGHRFGRAALAGTHSVEIDNALCVCCSHKGADILNHRSNLMFPMELPDK